MNLKTKMEIFEKRLHYNGTNTFIYDRRNGELYGMHPQLNYLEYNKNHITLLLPPKTMNQRDRTMSKNNKIKTKKQRINFTFYLTSKIHTVLIHTTLDHPLKRRTNSPAGNDCGFLMFIPTKVVCNDMQRFVDLWYLYSCTHEMYPSIQLMYECE